MVLLRCLRVYLGCRGKKYLSTSVEKRVVTKKQEGIICIGISGPEKNAADMELVSSLLGEVQAAEADPSCKVIVLHGSRGNLCAGYNTHKLSLDPHMMDKINSLGLLEYYCRVPVVAAVNGFAQGFGFELALWADLRVVEECAVMGFPRIPGLEDVAADEGRVRRLVNTVGQVRALDWLLTARNVYPDEALASGIANRLVATGSGLGQAFNLACGLSNTPASSLAATRASVYGHSNKYPSGTAKLL